MAKAPKFLTKVVAKSGAKPPMPKGGAKGGKAALFQPKGRGMVPPPARKAK